MSSDSRVTPFMASTGVAAIGYLNAGLLSDKRLQLAERGLHAWTGSLGIELVTVLIEPSPDEGVWRVPVFDDLSDEINARNARYVVVPDLDHFSPHPLLQAERVDRVQRDGTVTVLPVKAYTEALRMVL